ncbi:glycosyltransferase family 2 protein [Ferruginibacter albus]|uniref:glycosyltransferase family 2 protein n=1 Tax=Ferruginibacter albus TaxID=2875540 RepID=UPI001CC518CF|nr:glycosyltransferase family 2 protein [Ferruginibacter albus]UAY52222.1 glycosyltransferase family 2 protein [Ferruginibacter albus]
MEKAIAVVVTYNRKQLLSECITALRNQTRKLDAILVVDNGSTDDTVKWLSKQSDITFISQSNVGSAGGFNTGITWAYKNNFSWIWCMDDDGYPKEDALEKLLAEDMERLCLRNCAVLNKEDKKTFVWKTGNFNTIDDVNVKVLHGVGHPFNGTMLHRNIIERVGAPKQQLFLWGDETEYFYRITKQNGIPVKTITDSIHYHPAAAFTYKQDWDYKNTWKMYYYIRNRFYIHQAKFSNKLIALINYITFLTAMVGVVMIFQKTDKLKKINFILWPAADAFANDFSANPKSILLQLQETTQPTHRFRNSFSAYIKQLTGELFAPFLLSRTRGALNA